MRIERAALVAAAVACAMHSMQPRAAARGGDRKDGTTVTLTGDDEPSTGDAALLFGPGRSPWLDAARDVEAGQSISDAALKEAAADIDRRFQKGEFRLLDFAWTKRNVPAMGQLLAAGADPKLPIQTHGRMAQQDLVFQVLTCQQEPIGVQAIKVLLEHGLDPNWRRTPDRVPILQYPVLARDLEMASALLAAGADPWAVSGEAMAPYSTVRIAADSQDLPFLDHLAQTGAFDRRPPDEVASIIRSLARIRQSGDDTSKAIQATTRLILARARIEPDADARYILDGR